MRILVSCEHEAIVGGVETYLRGVLPGLITRGHDVALLCTHTTQKTTATIHAGCNNIPVWSSQQVDQAIQWKPQVCYQHTMPTQGAQQELASRFPSVLYSHNYQGTCISATKCHSSPNFQPCERTLGPGCLAKYFPNRCGGKNPIKMLQLYRIQRDRQQAFHDHQAVLVASRAMATELVRNGVQKEMVHHVPYFPPDLEPDAISPPPKPLTHRILFMGRLTALKGWSHLLTAIPRAATLLNRPLQLIVAGDGPDRQAFQQATIDQNIPTEFVGWLEPKPLLEQMRAADLLIVPSVWPEPFGLVGIEAGCVGLPAVGYAVGGIPDWLKPGISGELASGDTPNPDELADAVVRAIGDESHWQKLRVGAWEMAKQFPRQRHLDQLEKILIAATQQK